MSRTYYFCTHCESRHVKRTRDLQHVNFHYYSKLWSGHMKCTPELEFMYRDHATGTIPMTTMIHY